MFVLSILHLGGDEKCRQQIKTQLNTLNSVEVSEVSVPFSLSRFGEIELEKWLISKKDPGLMGGDT